MDANKKFKFSIDRGLKFFRINQKLSVILNQSNKT
jgi:hypothetical protein